MDRSSTTSLMTISSIHSLGFLVSPIWSMMYSVSPLSEYTGSYRDTGSLILSKAITTSCLGASTSLQTSSIVGSRCRTLVRCSLA